MQTQDISGIWQLRQAGKKEFIPAAVPGCVHTDLLAAGKIPDPYYRDNESRLQWIGEVQGRGGDIRVTLSSKAPALWVWLEAEGVDIKLSDNFSHLRPGQPVEIILQPNKPVSITEMRKKLAVQPVRYIPLRITKREIRNKHD